MVGPFALSEYKDAEMVLVLGKEVVLVVSKELEAKMGGSMHLE
jgi:hypothetical protein